MNLATAELRSLSLYRNGSKAGNIPRDKLSTKISGLAVDTEYTFHLILRTSAGTYTSERLTIRTQKMTDLTGITITPGVMPAQLREDLAATVERIGAKLIDTVRIDTTHFVCAEGRGQAWEKAVEMNVPVVVPDWVKGCEREGRIVGVRGYYLNADPKLRQVGPGAVNQSQTSLGPQYAQGSSDRRPSNLSQQPSQLRVHPPLTSPRIEHTPPTPERPHPDALTNGSDEPPTPPPKNPSPVTSAPVAKHSPLAEAEAAPITPPAEPENIPEVVVSDAPDSDSEVDKEEEEGEEKKEEVKENKAEVEEEEIETFPGASNPPPIDTTTEKPAAAAAVQNGVEEPTQTTNDPEPESKSEPQPADAEADSQPVNNLKAIGIPHGPEATKEEVGGFDEVDL